MYIEFNIVHFSCSCLIHTHTFIPNWLHNWFYSFQHV